MSQPCYFTWSAPDADGVCLSQTLGAAGALTINGALLDNAALSLGSRRAKFDGGTNRVVSLTSTGNLSGINFTVTGYDSNWTAVSETRAGPNNNTVETTALFWIVTGVTANAAVATAITVGSGTTGHTGWYPLSTYKNPVNVGIVCVVDSGTINYDVQYTADDIFRNSSPTAIDHPDIAGETTTQSGNIAYPVTAIRGLVNSSTDGAMKFQFIQAGV